jgi:hypothetical protein
VQREDHASIEQVFMKCEVVVVVDGELLEGVIAAERAEEFNACAGGRTARRQQAARGRVARHSQPDTGEEAGAFFVENLERANLRIVDVLDVHLFQSQTQRAAPHIVESLAQGQASADALVGVIFANAVAQIEFAAEAVGLVEDPGLGEADIGIGDLCARLEAGAEGLAGSGEAFVEQVAPTRRPVGYVKVLLLVGNVSSDAAVTVHTRPDIESCGFSFFDFDQ